jgi:hypothetical protein
MNYDSQRTARDPRTVARLQQKNQTNSESCERDLGEAGLEESWCDSARRKMAGATRRVWVITVRKIQHILSGLGSVRNEPEAYVTRSR